MKRYNDIYVVYGITTICFTIFFGCYIHAYYVGKKYRLTRTEIKMATAEINKAFKFYEEKRKKNKYYQDDRVVKLFTNDELKDIEKKCNESSFLGPLFFKILKKSLYRENYKFLAKVAGYNVYEEVIIIRVFRIWLIRTINKQKFDLKSYEKDVADSKMFMHINGTDEIKKAEIVKFLGNLISTDENFDVDRIVGKLRYQYFENKKGE